MPHAVPVKALATPQGAPQPGLHASVLSFQFPMWAALEEGVTLAQLTLLPWDASQVPRGAPRAAEEGSFIPEGAPAPEAFSICHVAGNGSVSCLPPPKTQVSVLGSVWA